MHRARGQDEGGFGFLGKRLADKCKDSIKVGMEATRIDVLKKEIEFNHNEVVSYENILSSLPLPELIKIIPDAPDEVREAASRLKTNSIFVVNIGVNRANITDKNWIYYLEKKFSFIIHKLNSSSAFIIKFANHFHCSF